jgi:signal transduction histidine kinase
VRSRLPRGGLRTQLALAIALVAALAVAASFLALYSGTSARLRTQIDTQLHTQAAEWRQFAQAADTSTQAALARTTRRFIAGQGYHAESLVIVFQLNGLGVVSNDPELVAREGAREHRGGESEGLLNAPIGLSTQPVAEAGAMRVLSVPVMRAGRQVGTLRVANPLTPVQQAQSSMRREFLLVGLVAVGVAALVGLALAAVIAAPLRRMARVAGAVERGDLHERTGPISTRGEMRVLADAMDNMLDRLERTFGRQRDFVSDASHELRTPLAVLRAQVELLDREQNERRRHEAAITLLSRIDELDRLVGDMLTLATAEAGQLVEPRQIDLHDFFEDLRRDMPLFGERDFRVVPVDGTLYADPDRVTQILRNLIRNAVTHTTAGDRVSVTARARDELLEVDVTDSGPGIPPDQLELVFERFHRLDRGRSRVSGGSGLGLAIARAIARAHGGRLYATSAPGPGATFVLELPGYRPPLPRQRPLPQGHPPAQPGNPAPG